jgi:fatty-acyl-CoA synthase
MIILKGKKIYPIDIEEVLSKYPKIAAARVIGIPDRLRGEVVGAVILLKERVEATAQEIKRFCQEHMSDYKLPRQVIFTTQASLANLSKIANIRLSQRKLKELLSSLSNLPSPLKYKKKTSKAQ